MRILNKSLTIAGSYLCYGWANWEGWKSFTFTDHTTHTSCSSSWNCELHLGNKSSFWKPMREEKMMSSFLKNTVLLFFAICLLQILGIERSNWAVKPCFGIKIFVWFVCPWRNQAAAASLPWEPLVTIFNSARGCLSIQLLQCRQVISNISILSYSIPKWLGMDITVALQHLWYCSCVLLWAAWSSCARLQPLLPLSWWRKDSCCLNRLAGPAINKGRDCKQPPLAGRASSSPSRAADSQVPVALEEMVLEKGALHP